MVRLPAPRPKRCACRRILSVKEGLEAFPCTTHRAKIRLTSSRSRQRKTLRETLSSRTDCAGWDQPCRAYLWLRLAHKRMHLAEVQWPFCGGLLGRDVVISPNCPQRYSFPRVALPLSHRWSLNLKSRRI